MNEYYVWEVKSSMTGEWVYCLTLEKSESRLRKEYGNIEKFDYIGSCPRSFSLEEIRNHLRLDPTQRWS